MKVKSSWLVSNVKLRLRELITFCNNYISSVFYSISISNIHISFNYIFLFLKLSTLFTLNFSPAKLSSNFISKISWTCPVLFFKSSIKKVYSLCFFSPANISIPYFYFLPFCFALCTNCISNVQKWSFFVCFYLNYFWYRDIVKNKGNGWFFK